LKSPANRRLPISFLLVLFIFFFGLPMAEGDDLIWSTFLGGAENDKGEDVAVDDAGCVYLVGATRSTNFPVAAGVLDTTYNGETDAFVAKVNAAGDSLEYATFLGGSGGDRGFGIAVDETGCAYLTGLTYSANFPVTVGAFDTSHNSNGSNLSDIFVVKLNQAGDALHYGTFVGGSRDEDGIAVAVDSIGDVYVTGYTRSADFPTTLSAFDTTHNSAPNYSDVFVVKIDPVGSSLIYATFLGGGASEYAEGIALDNSGSAYVVGDTRSDDFPVTSGAFDTDFNGGSDVFVVKFTPAGDSLAYATLIGGVLDDRAYGVAVNDLGNAHVTGYTQSTDFPTTTGAYDRTHNGSRDIFAVRLDAMGTLLDWATFLGGASDDRGLGIAVDDSDKILIAGRARSSDFPTTTGAFDRTHNGEDDGVLVKLGSAGGLLEYSTFLGGSGLDWGNDISLDPFGNIYLAGSTHSVDFPATDESYDPIYNGNDDVFVAKFHLSGTSVISQSPGSRLPQTFVLQQNYPNPFNANTKIRYQILEKDHVTLTIFNSRGQRVRTLVDADREFDWHEATWNGEDSVGRKVASGVYLCVLNVGRFVAVKKMVLLR
jgi:hypothetical protein